MKKIFALVLALMLVLGMTSAMAVTITVNRDTTFQTGADGNRDYTWYRVFTVVKNGTYTATGGGYDTDGTPGTVSAGSGSTATAFAYTASLAVANKLGTYTASSNTWVAADNQTWFTLTPIAGSSPKTFSVEWTAANEDTDTAQAAAQWLFTNQVWDATGSLTGVDGTKDNDDNFTQWSATGLEEGYYLLKGTEGQNLIAATTDININEKNSYPTVDKKQKADPSTEVSYADDALGVKVGDIIYYQISVTVPADANMPIAVVDKMSDGLTYNANSMAITVDGTALDTSKYAAMTSTDDEYVADADWQYKITPDAATKGKTVLFTFNATVNSTALTETGRENEVTLKYNNNHYVKTDKVEFDIGAAAIVKYDGATADYDSTTGDLTKKATVNAIKYLEATFTLTDAAGTAINVSGSNGVYTVDANSNSNSVTTNKSADGGLLIYGLDPDVTYYLTETATEYGYNLLSAPVELTVVKSEKTTDANVANTTKAVAGSLTAGNASADEAHILTLTAKQIAKVQNLSGSTLPSTGGVGTTIFYIGGSILVLAAVIFLVTKRRMNANND